MSVDISQLLKASMAYSCSWHKLISYIKTANVPNTILIVSESLLLFPYFYPFTRYDCSPRIFLEKYKLLAHTRLTLTALRLWLQFIQYSLRQTLANPDRLMFL